HPEREHFGGIGAKQCLYVGSHGVSTLHGHLLLLQQPERVRSLGEGVGWRSRHPPQSPPTILTTPPIAKTLHAASVICSAHRTGIQNREMGFERSLAEQPAHQITGIG